MPINLYFVTWILGISCGLALAGTWLLRRDRFCPWQILLPFLILAILSLDGGLLRLLLIVGQILRLGDSWAPHVAGLWWNRPLSLILAILISITSIIILFRMRQSFQRSFAIGILSGNALLQGMIRMRWISEGRIIELMTGSIEEPWGTFIASAPNTIVIIAVIMFVIGNRPKNHDSGVSA